MRYLFLLLLAAIAACCLTFSTVAFAQGAATAAPPDDGFVSISDPTLGNFKIENAPVTVQQYKSFLNAIALQGDPHGLYNKEMSSLIAYHTTGCFEEANYSTLSNQDAQPITFVSCDDAMRYCNWLQNGKKLGVQASMTTEKGAYNFSNENGQEIVIVDPEATYFLPTVDQLAASGSQIIFPENAGFFEWTSTAAANVSENDNEESDDIDELVFQTVTGEEPVTMACVPSTLNPSIGFRIALKEKITTPETSSESAEFAHKISSITGSSQQLQKGNATVNAQDGETQAVFADAFSVALFSFFWTATGCQQAALDPLLVLMLT